MFEIHLAQKRLDMIGYADQNNKLGVVNKSEHLFNRSRFQGRLGQLWATLSKHSTQLLDLRAIEADYVVMGRFDKGVQVIAVDQIRGSENRTADFDRNFHPLQHYTQQRWLSVAKALLNDINLPPIQVIQVGDDYFVRDGHHRVSVAKALQYLFIEAEVIVWQVRPRLTTQPPVMAGNCTGCPA